MQVELDGIVESENDDQIDRAAEPGELVFEERAGLGDVLGREPVLFVGKVDELGRQRADQAGDAESDESDQQAGSGEDCEENFFGLPTIGDAAGVEVRDDDRGKLRIAAGKVDDGAENK